MTLRPLVDTHHEDLSWMEDAKFQVPTPEYRRRQTRARFAIVVLSALAIATGALIGLSYSGILGK